MAHHQQLLDWIENELINQTLRLGDDLPDDRALAREVGISQNHMRESLKHCEEIGVLKLYEGRRKSIIAQLVREPAASAGPAISLYLAGSRSPRQDLLATCLLLEEYALAAPAYDESAFEELDRIVEDMQDATASLSDFHDLEADFHIQLGRLSGNALISALLATMRAAMIEARFELVNQVPLWSATASRLRMEYRAIVDAARSKDAALAQSLLRANLHERFAEAGHRVDLEKSGRKETGLAFEPIEVETQELVPEEWGGPIEPELFEALATIQPIGREKIPPQPLRQGTRPQGQGKEAQSGGSCPAEEAHEETAAAQDSSKGAENSKKRFDLVGYFGFGKGPKASQAAPSEQEPAEAKTPETGHKQQDDSLREGYEYAAGAR